MKNTKNIETIDDLQRAVDSDTNTQETKDLTELFLNAMIDWPSYNQTKIADFVKELKDFYGHPLTLEKIDNKRVDLSKEHDAWRLESGSSIAEMMEKAKLFLNESDFDKTIQHLLEYYKREKGSAQQNL